MLVVLNRSFFGVGQLKSDASQLRFVESSQCVARFELVLVLDEGIIFGSQTNVSAITTEIHKPRVLDKHLSESLSCNALVEPLAEEDMIRSVVDLKSYYPYIFCFLEIVLFSLGFGLELLGPLYELFLEFELIVVLGLLSELKGAVKFGNDI
jgi:hypothetical protein